MMLLILLQIFCLCLAQSQINSTNYFGSGFGSSLLNTTTQIIKTSVTNITSITGESS